MAGSQDSIDFYARYGSWTCARSISIADSTSQKEVAAQVAAVREEAGSKAFEVLGIDQKALDNFAEKFTKPFPKNDYSSLVNIYKALSSAQAEPEISKAAQGKEELKPFAKAYLFRAALRQLGLNWYLTKENKVFEGKAAQKASTAVPFSSEGISFMAKYKDWISIKKLSIDKNTKPEEVAAHLSSIRMTTDRKIAQILGVDTDILDAYATEMTGKMRKSAANIEKITAILSSPEAKKQIESAIKGYTEIRDAATIYLFSRMLQNIKVDLEVSPDTLMDMFPGLKIPKPKGRMPGQKKKAAA
ncbi:MAG: DUF2666 family protein [Candidatus Micrarchaeota archaeon]|nr:DUF2666 family protein [Candidatus Micrarchaeota archaeon]MDE1834002.1 DUF2666 family protein [Candidatus Micrarchaeota archaeon]MDE1859508.1 DUF2666 family protein [Candidatus Micrarchaeota archaeon]